MFEIRIEEGGAVMLAGRFDASRTAEAEAAFRQVNDNAIVDFQQLEYISSAGLGVLVAEQKRLTDSGASMRIVNASNHIKDIFRFSGLNKIFEIE